MKHKVSELEGDLLNAAVAQAQGLEWRHHDGYLKIKHQDLSGMRPGWIAYTPADAWMDGGPIIERERIAVEHEPTERRIHVPPAHDNLPPWHAWVTHPNGLRSVAFGDTPLIAAMRAFVASRFGEEVELP